MNEEELLNQNAEAQSEIDRLKSIIRKNQQMIAEHRCPFKVGQRVVNPKGEEQIVANIEFKNWAPGYNFTVCKIKKNGDPYASSSYVYGDCTKYKAI